MRFFVYYDYGNCNQGDHESGLQECGTLQEAETFVQRVKKRNFSNDGICVVVHGERVADESEKAT